MSIRPVSPTAGFGLDLPRSLMTAMDTPGGRALEQLRRMTEPSPHLRSLMGGLPGTLAAEQALLSRPAARLMEHLMTGTAAIPPIWSGSPSLQRLMDTTSDTSAVPLAHRLSDPTGVIARLQKKLSPSAHSGVPGKLPGTPRRDSPWANLIHREAFPTTTLDDLLRSPAFPAAAALIRQHLPQDEEANEGAEAPRPDERYFQAALRAFDTVVERQEHMAADLREQSAQLTEIATNTAPVQHGTRVVPVREIVALLLVLISILAPHFSDEAFESWQTEQARLEEARTETLVRGQYRLEQGQNELQRDVAGVQTAQAEMEEDLTEVQQSQRRTEQAIAALQPTHTVGERNVQVRQRPRGSSAVAAHLSPNVGVTVVASYGHWVKVEWRDLVRGEHRSGWCLKKYLRRAKSPSL